MKNFFKKSAFTLGLLAVTTLVRAEPGIVSVQVQVAPGKAWTNYPTRTLAALPVAVTGQTDPDLDQYGGLLARKGKATGFFYPKKIGERWWLIDPDGGQFLHKAVVAVTPMGGPGAKAAFQEKFGGDSNWVARTSGLLHEEGFNGLGAWSDTARLRQAARPLVYTRIWDFMSSYGQKRGGTYQQSGHVGYPKDCIFVFDPEFEKFCDSYAQQLAKSKDDPWLLGHFSDNEMPFKRNAIINYLQLPENDPGHQAALAWLQARHGAAATVKDITEQDKEDFLALVTDRYYGIVSRAIKKHDPNHLFLGSRFHGEELNYPEVIKAAGAYVDVLAVNYYRTWTPSQEKLAMWSRESGRPILITEWYVKGEDSGLSNNSGAGWIVKSQHDRGLFYQNFALGLLESKVCVGWHWFKYSDNDPSEPNTDPSNRDSNKGIVTFRYEPYATLLEEMKPLNDRVYVLADYFDRPAGPMSATK
ncbi:MAG TPA: hypothetical protein VK815_08160 [Candidatus Acidoferrales bacterium]|nr:hypothetical protein [Candidatus Acidoferrales bacterium]